MLGSFLNRILILVLGYAYPAYECYKTVEKNKPEIEQLLFWCQYWILVALITVLERIGDMLISWMPMYSEAKVAFLVYLWLPKTKGTTYVYDTLLKPYLSEHEKEIDRHLLELRARAGDSAAQMFQKSASYSQARFFEILNFVGTKSQTFKPQQSQQHQRQAREYMHTEEEEEESLSHAQAGPPPMVRQRKASLERQKTQPAPNTTRSQPTAANTTRSRSFRPAPPQEEEYDEPEVQPSDPNQSVTNFFSSSTNEDDEIEFESNSMEGTEGSSLEPNEGVMEQSIRATQAARLRKTGPIGLQ